MSAHSARLLAALLAPLLLAACCARGRGHEGEGDHAPEHGQRHGHGEGHGHGDDQATVRHAFDDAEAWARRFEDPERDAWQEPERVLQALALAPDAKVADIGAGTGYFPVRFARACPQGLVYGVDVEPAMVNYLNLRARREGLSNLLALVCPPDDSALPEMVDLVFLCDTYHHIDDRVAYFTKLRQRLRPGGRLAIVDFSPDRPSPTGPPVEHRLAAEKVVEELGRAGWRLASREELRYQYLLVFTPGEGQAPR